MQTTMFKIKDELTLKVMQKMNINKSQNFIELTNTQSTITGAMQCQNVTGTAGEQ